MSPALMTSSQMEGLVSTVPANGGGAVAKANGNGVAASANGNGVAAKQNAVPSIPHTLLGAPYEPPLSPGDPDWDLHVPSTNMDAKDKGTADAWCVGLLRLMGTPSDTFRQHGGGGLMYIRQEKESHTGFF